MQKTIKLKKIYHLDVGALAPSEVKTIKFLENGVECRWVWGGRIDVMPYSIFEVNGYSKPKGLSFPETIKNPIPEIRIPEELKILSAEKVQEILRIKDKQKRP